jgi:hypothetical protein
MKTDALKDYIRILVESRLRETDISDGSRVPFGSNKHIADLELRIVDLEKWRDRQRRGSETRANYARLISRLRAELRSAERYSERKATETVEKIKPQDPEDLIVDD